MMLAQAIEMEVKIDPSSLVSVTDAIEKEWQRHKARMQDIHSNRRANNSRQIETETSGENTVTSTWKQQVAVLESRFGVSKMVAQLLEQRAKQAHEERMVAQSKVRELAGELQRMTNTTTNTTNSAAERQKTAKKLAKAEKVAGEKEEMMEKLTTRCEQQSRQLRQIQQDLAAATQQSKNDKNEPSEERILALRMRLVGTERINAYLDSQLLKSRLSEAQLAQQVLTLEADLSKLARKLTKLHSQGAPPKKLQKVVQNIEPIKARLLQTQGVTQALQSQLLEMQQAKLMQEKERESLARQLDEMQEHLKAMTATSAPMAEIQVNHQSERIAELEEQLVQAKKVLKSVVEKWGPTKAENKEQVDSLKEENKALQERLQQAMTAQKGEASRPRPEERRLFRQVGDLEGKLAESKRVVRFLEGLVTKTRGEKANAELKAKTAEEQLEELQSQFKKMDSRHKAEVNAFKAFSCLAHKVGDYVKNNPNFTPGQPGQPPRQGVQTMDFNLGGMPGQPPRQGVQTMDFNLGGNGMPRPLAQAINQLESPPAPNALDDIIRQTTPTTTTTSPGKTKIGDDSSGAEESTAETSSTGSIDM